MAVVTLLVFIGVVVVVGILGLNGHGISRGDPRLLWIAIPLLLIYSFNLWKDKKAFFKRCVLALPFAVIAAILLMVIGFKILISCIAGVLLFVSLVAETKNWKRHYVITLTTASIIIILAIALKGFNLL